MSYFLSTATVEKAYKSLIDTKFDNPSILHIFFILKGCGYNNLNYLPDTTISEQGLNTAFKLGSLFAPIETAPDHYNFINPFEMSGWSAQAVSEPLKKWVQGRIKNNVLGGATTWRAIVNLDPKTNMFKFTYDYVNEISILTIKTDKINLLALALWFNRFTEFDNKYSLIAILDNFVKELNLNKEEISTLTTVNATGLLLEYETDHCDYEYIRKLIGKPDGETAWLKTKSASNYLIKGEYVMSDNNTTLSENKVIELLQSNMQLILSGPPATSKSYIAHLVSKHFDKVENIQFHPQYSYQEFIGGYIVNGDKVEYRKGLLLLLIEYANQHENEKCLLIIDEINRANVSQVMGEALQCLDRNYTTKINVAGVLTEFNIPKNLYILGTMNTSDRTIGSLDHALKRRFYNIYVSPQAKELIDTTKFEGHFSLSDLLEKINNKAAVVLKNKELTIGQAVFYNENYLDNKVFMWDFDKLEDLFNYKLLPMFEDYCYGDTNKLIDIFGSKLINRLSGDDFRKAIEEYLL